MRIVTALVLILLASHAVPSFADLPQVGEPLTPLSIDDKGEMILDDDDIGFRDWHSDAAQGYPHIIQYLAARMSASKINEPFTDALDAADLPPDQYRVTTIINLDDALWGTGGFVIRELEKNKREHPHAVMVSDAGGLGLSTWNLERENSAIMLVDADGTVRFFKQGALTEADIDQVLQMLRDAIAGETADAA